MGGRTAPNGTISYTPIDHTYANSVPGATLTPENPLAGLNEIARQVGKSGIKHVKGNVIIDDRLFDLSVLDGGQGRQHGLQRCLPDHEEVLRDKVEVSAAVANAMCSRRSVDNGSGRRTRLSSDGLGSGCLQPPPQACAVFSGSCILRRKSCGKRGPPRSLL